MFEKPKKFDFKSLLENPTTERDIRILQSIHEGLFEFVDNILGREEGWNSEMYKRQDSENYTIICFAHKKEDQDELYKILFDRVMELNQSFLRNNQPYYVKSNNDEKTGRITLKVGFIKQ